MKLVINIFTFRDFSHKSLFWPFLKRQLRPQNVRLHLCLTGMGRAMPEPFQLSPAPPSPRCPNVLIDHEAICHCPQCCCFPSILFHNAPSASVFTFSYPHPKWSGNDPVRSLYDPCKSEWGKSPLLAFMSRGEEKEACVLSGMHRDRLEKLNTSLDYFLSYLNAGFFLFLTEFFKILKVFQLL